MQVDQKIALRHVQFDGKPLIRRAFRQDKKYL